VPLWSLLALAGCSACFLFSRLKVFTVLFIVVVLFCVLLFFSEHGDVHGSGVTVMSD
jgi:hypothetical protein